MGEKNDPRNEWDLDLEAKIRSLFVDGPEETVPEIPGFQDLELGLGADEISFPLPSNQLALKMLSQWTQTDSEDDAPKVARVISLCDSLPLALALCGAAIREGETWDDLIEALEDADIEFLSLPDLSLGYEYENVFRSMAVGFEFLRKHDEFAAARYLELCVFAIRHGQVLPEDVILEFWAHEHHLKKREGRRLLNTLHRKSLLRRERSRTDPMISLHGLQSAFITRKYEADHEDSRVQLHQHLLSAYEARCSGGWSTGPNDGYFFQNLCHHLESAEKADEVRGLLVDVDWVWKKLSATDIAGLLEDYARMPDDVAIASIGSAIRLCAHVLSFGQQSFLTQLHGRLIGCSGARSLTTSIEERAEVVCCVPSLDPPMGPLTQTMTGHTDDALSVAVSLDGSHIVSGGYDKSVRVWDLSTGECVKILNGSVSQVMSVTFNNSGSQLLSAGTTCCTWDYDTGNKLPGLSTSAAALYVSPNRKYGVSRDQSELEVWNLDRRELVVRLHGHRANVLAAAISDDGQRVISCDNYHTMILWDVAKGKPIKQLSSVEFNFHAFAICGNERVIAGNDNGQLLVWDMSDEGFGISRVFQEGHQKRINSVAVTSDWRYAVSGSMDGAIILWDIDKGESIRTLTGHAGSVWEVVITPDDSYAVSCGQDGSVRLWDLRREAAPRIDQHGDRVSGIAISVDGTFAASASWDNTIKLWNLAPVDVACDLKIGESRASGDHANSIAFVKDSMTAIVAVDRNVESWDVRSGHRLWKIRADSIVTRVQVVGNRVISFTSSSVSVCDLLSGECLYEFSVPEPRRRPTIVAITRDGSIAVVASRQHELCFWNIESQNAMMTRDGRDRISAMDIPCDRIAVTGHWNGVVRIWDLDSDTTRCITDNTEKVNAIAASVTANMVVSGSDDHSVRIWNLKSCEPVSVFVADHAIRSVAITDELVIAGDDSGRVHFLRYLPNIA